MRPYIFNALEEIDAAMFSGDAFFNEEEGKEHREELRRYMNRWNREMNAIEIAEARKENSK